MDNQGRLIDTKISWAQAVLRPQRKAPVKRVIAQIGFGVALVLFSLTDAHAGFCKTDMEVDSSIDGMACNASNLQKQKIAKLQGGSAICEYKCTCIRKGEGKKDDYHWMCSVLPDKPKTK